MSRIGKNPVAVPAGVQVAMNGTTISAKGPKGELAVTVADSITATIDGGKIGLKPREDTSGARVHVFFKRDCRACGVCRARKS